MRLRQWINGYLVVIGRLCNVLLVVAAGYAFSDTITHHWRWKQVETFVLATVGDWEIVNRIEPVMPGNPNRGYSHLPEKRWIKIHQQQRSDPVQFKRQPHGGSAFDSKRGRLVLFGSDTHGEDWSNVVRIFDMSSVKWIPTAQPDDYQGYVVDSAGEPSARADVKRPWAMHTFDAVDYDPVNDQLMVASHPDHLKPDRFGQWMAASWGEIKKHPTWFYHFRDNSWSTGEGKAVSFFPYSIAYDSKRQRFVGFRPDGVFQYAGARGWQRIAKKGINAYHTNAVYDPRNDAFIILGTHTSSNAVYLFRNGDRGALEQPTPGLRPPGMESVPAAFHPGVGKTVVLVDSPVGEKGGAQTWLYDIAEDRWEQIDEAVFPFKLGMNYNMQYDPIHNQLVLVAGGHEDFTSVWVLRL
ncbi:hypothetical protein [Sedimenticola hydrogenitrophicus]|uniref:hypothetical protein n=1 Tax=Sedimenticola hydrogenitrophicus TaxID=2967975 RepID=UPI0023AE789D|nr:hypothetical protein [Sedimenticola hydrogenitrophicus]